MRESTLLNGFAALWNETRDLWAAEKGILLSLAQTDGSGLWLAGILLGLFLAAQPPPFAHSDFGLNAALIS